MSVVDCKHQNSGFFYYYFAIFFIKKKGTRESHEKVELEQHKTKQSPTFDT